MDICAHRYIHLKNGRSHHTDITEENWFSWEAWITLLSQGSGAAWLCRNMQTQWCYQWTELAPPVVYNRRHIQIDLWLTFSFCRWRKYLMINFPLWQKLFPYKTKNLTHKRWKRPANASSLSPRQHCTGCYSTELFTKVRKLPIPNLQHSHPLPWFSYQPLTMGQRR